MSQFENNKKKKFAETLRNVIKDYGDKRGERLTQEEFAEEIEVARETISYWLNGKSYPGTDAINRICAFFALPPNFFESVADEEGLTYINEKTHDHLQQAAEETAQRIGLKSGLYAFIKENPALADAVVSVSWVDDILQSANPDVPELPDHTFQMKTSSGVKIYPPDEILYMLRVVQRDLADYALFLIQKWSQIIREEHKELSVRGPFSHGPYGTFDKDGNEFVPAIERYRLELKGHGSLTPRSSLMVEMYNLSSPEGQSAMVKNARDVYHEYRKKDPKAQKVRKAVTKARISGKPLPPVDEILKDETEE